MNSSYFKCAHSFSTALLWVQVQSSGDQKPFAKKIQYWNHAQAKEVLLMYKTLVTTNIDDTVG